MWFVMARSISLVNLAPTKLLWGQDGTQKWPDFAGHAKAWLVVWTPLKNISQLGWLFPIYGKIKNVPNHQPEAKKVWTIHRFIATNWIQCYQPFTSHFTTICHHKNCPATCSKDLPKNSSPTHQLDNSTISPLQHSPHSPHSPWCPMNSTSNGSQPLDFCPSGCSRSGSYPTLWRHWLLRCPAPGPERAAVWRWSAGRKPARSMKKIEENWRCLGLRCWTQAFRKVFLTTLWESSCAVPSFFLWTNAKSLETFRAEIQCF